MNENVKAPLAMSESEIVRSYREAKDPKKQVHILAQLNAVSFKVINEILIRNGADPEKLPKISEYHRKPKSAGAEKKAPAKKKTETKPQSVGEPASLTVALLNGYIKELEEKLNKIAIQVEALSAEGERCANRLTDIMKAKETLCRVFDINETNGEEAENDGKDS